MSERLTLYRNAVVHSLQGGIEDVSTAEAFAVSGGRFVAVGLETKVRAQMQGAFDTVDLQGSTVVPGFVDAHAHLIDFGLMLQSTADLTHSRSVRELQDRLRSHAQKRPTGWLFGHGFDQELFETHAFPTRQDLDAVCADRPLIITRICGHAAVGNTFALQHSSGPLPPGASESGLLTEDDISLITAHAPEPTDAEIDDAILRAGSLATSLGLTGVHCLLADMRQLDRLRELDQRNELPIRFHAQILYRYLDECVARGLRTGQGSDYLTIGAMKIFSDGSFGARTAAMHDDYSDDPGNRGILLIDQPELAEMVEKAQAAGFQCAIHAIGDKAVDVTVGAIADACALSGGNNPLRHRIEHASQMTTSALRAMVSLKIPVAVQPQFVLTDFWTVHRVGKERYRWSYPFRTMQEAGVHLAMSSDCWVEKLDPYELIYRACVRDEVSKSESLTPRETVYAYTRGSAYAAGQESQRGAIVPGMLADAVVFDEPLLDIAPETLLKIRPRGVLTGGNLRLF